MEGKSNTVWCVLKYYCQMGQILSIYVHIVQIKIFNSMYEVATNQPELILAMELEWGCKGTLVCWTLTL